MLERIEIENLGAIQKASVTLSPLTVLVGANASGKTTVMRGIELFAALRQKPLQEVFYATHSLMGPTWPMLLHGGISTKNLVFRGFTLPDSAQPDYELHLGINWDRWSKNILEQTDAAIEEPELLLERLRDPRGGWIEAGIGGKFSIRGSDFSPPVPRHDSIARLISRLAHTPNFQSKLADLADFVSSLGTARYFRPNSEAMLTLMLGEDRVLPGGEGFIAALAALQNRELERFIKIEEHLRGLFPHIRRIRFDVNKSIRTLVFETERSRQLTPADMEADGVLTTLFLLWAGATTPPHGTLLIDEPETALHPHLMGRRIEFLRSLANGEFTGHPLRVVVATQSVDFVRWLDTSELRVVEYGPETGTLVHTIPDSETLRTLTDKFQANAGDLWYSGAIGGTPGTAE
jgi:predicted ATPase